MAENVKLALSLDSMEQDPLTTYMLDDVLFIVKKCINLATGSQNVDCIYVIINNASVGAGVPVYNYMAAVLGWQGCLGQQEHQDPSPTIFRWPSFMKKSLTYCLRVSPSPRVESSPSSRLFCIQRNLSRQPRLNSPLTQTSKTQLAGWIWWLPAKHDRRGWKLMTVYYGKKSCVCLLGFMPTNS